jgi:hypothetical protein
MTKEERLLATTTLPMEATIDDATHKIDPKLCTTSQEKMMVWAYMMTQYNLKPGLRKFRVKELTQLHIMDTWTPLEASKLSREQQMCALSSLLFLKESMHKCKWSATARIHLQGRSGITNSIKQIHIQTAAIAAAEKRKVRCYDVPSAFVNTDVDEDVIMVLKGDLADMMVQIAPETYRKYITTDKKGTRILYVKLQKVLYGLT